MTNYHYDTWNEMLNQRDELHTAYLRPYNGGKRWEMVRYSKFSEDCYLGFCGTNAENLATLIEKLQEQGYDVSEMDICTYGEV